MRINWIIFGTTWALACYFIVSAFASMGAEAQAATITWEQPLLLATIICVAFWGGFFSHERKIDQ